jgi:hypothetical protein
MQSTIDGKKQPGSDDDENHQILKRSTVAPRKPAKISLPTHSNLRQRIQNRVENEIAIATELTRDRKVLRRSISAFKGAIARREC